MKKSMKNLMKTMGYQNSSIEEIDFLMRHKNFLLTDFSFEKKTESVRFYILNKDESYSASRVNYDQISEDLSELGYGKLAGYFSEFKEKYDLPLLKGDMNTSFPGFGYAAFKDRLFAVKPYVYLNESEKPKDIDGDLSGFSKRRYSVMKTYADSADEMNRSYMNKLFSTSLWSLSDIYMGTTYTHTGSYAQKVYLESSLRDNDAVQNLLRGVSEIKNKIQRKEPEISLLINSYLESYISEIEKLGLIFDIFTWEADRISRGFKFYFFDENKIFSGKHKVDDVLLLIQKLNAQFRFKEEEISYWEELARKSYENDCYLYYITPTIKNNNNSKLTIYFRHKSQIEV